MEENELEIIIAKLFRLGIIILIFGCFFYFTFCYFINPLINVWRQGKEGEALLAHAEYSRQIATCEANAKKESAKALAEAEIIRARGVAEANRIIGDSLKSNEAYLRYLYINQLSESKDKTVIYVPTEAGLPIMEAGRLGKE